MWPISLKEIRRRVESEAHRMFRSAGELNRLQGRAGAVGGAIRSAIELEIAPEERRYVQAIENLREQMKGSTQQLEFVDFGSSHPGATIHTSLGAISRHSSKRGRQALMMLKLVRSLQAANVLELGTSVGISAAYQAVGLKINGRGRLFTLEGAPPLAAIATSNLGQLDLIRCVDVIVGRFADTLPGVLQRMRYIDFAFIDGHHDHTATLQYFKQIKPFLQPNAVVIFDDIDWSPGMAAAWEEIARDPAVSITVDLFSMGLCMLTGPKQAFRIAV